MRNAVKFVAELGWDVLGPLGLIACGGALLGIAVQAVPTDAPGDAPSSQRGTQASRSAARAGAAAAIPIGEQRSPTASGRTSGLQKHKAKLVIAKLDRLSRNVAFIANLLEAGTDFVAADNPHANKAMVQMMAVFAEMERDAISKRAGSA